MVQAMSVSPVILDLVNQTSRETFRRRGIDNVFLQMSPAKLTRPNETYLS